MKWNSWLRYPIDMHRARTALAVSSESFGVRENYSPESDVDVVFDLRTTNLTIDGARHLEASARHLISLSARCTVRCPKQILAVIARKTFGRRFLQLPGMTHRRVEDPLPQNSFVLTDVEPESFDDSSDHRVYWMKIGMHPQRDLPVMPYPMNPVIIEHWPPKNLDQLRWSTDRGNILFAGNQKERYGSGRIRDRFDLCDRIEMISTVTKHFARWIQRTLPANKNAIVLLDSRTHSIPPEGWLETLCGFDFFLCCPGNSQPTCHNLTEAMSVGTIPILEYDQRVTPELIDGETAITFRGSDGLIDAIQRAKAMSAAEIGRIRQNVIAMHDESLCQRRFWQRWLDGDWNQQQTETVPGTVQSISMPFHEHNLYSEFALAKAA